MSGAKRLVLLPVVLATLGSSAPAAWAAWPSDPNANVPLCTIANDQPSPTIISDGAAGAIVVWVDQRNGTANTDIYAQRVNAAGVPQWTADGVALCAATGNQSNPMITSDGAGGAIVTWYDGRGANYDIYAQRVNAAGTPQWTGDGVALCTAAGSQYFPTIESDGASGAIVTWQDFRSGTGFDIYAQRVNAAGTPQWSADGVALCTAPYDQQVPTIASDGAGGAIITWDGGSGTGYDIFAQRVSAAGVPQWSAGGVALCAAADNQLYPAITSDGVGGAFVSWEDNRSHSSYDIYAQRVNAAGVPQWTANGVALCTASGYQSSTTIVPDGAGGAIVTWNDARSGVNHIYARRVTGAGAPQWTADGVALSTAANGQFNPAIAPAGTGGAIVAWDDLRSGTNRDIYAQNINSDGSLGGTVVSVPPLSIAASFALHRVEPNPSVGDLSISFSLSDGTPATLELYDLTGRRIESVSVGSFGPGAHVTSLTPGAPSLPPGVYCVSLKQGSRRAFSKVAILR